MESAKRDDLKKQFKDSLFNAVFKPVQDMYRKEVTTPIASTFMEQILSLINKKDDEKEKEERKKKEKEFAEEIRRQNEKTRTSEATVDPNEIKPDGEKKTAKRGDTVDGYFGGKSTNAQREQFIKDNADKVKDHHIFRDEKTGEITKISIFPGEEYFISATAKNMNPVHKVPTPATTPAPYPTDKVKNNGGTGGDTGKNVGSPKLQEPSNTYTADTCNTDINGGKSNRIKILEVTSDGNIIYEDQINGQCGVLEDTLAYKIYEDDSGKINVKRLSHNNPIKNEDATLSKFYSKIKNHVNKVYINEDSLGDSLSTIGEVGVDKAFGILPKDVSIIVKTPFKGIFIMHEFAKQLEKVERLHGDKGIQTHAAAVGQTLIESSVSGAAIHTGATIGGKFGGLPGAVAGGLVGYVLSSEAIYSYEHDEINKKTTYARVNDFFMGQTPDRIKALRSVDDNSYILNDDIRDYIRERGGFSYAEPFPRYNKNNDDKE